MAHPDRIGELAGFRMLESESPPMRRAIGMARRAAVADAPILLTGESGTGKQILGSAIHEWSGRSGPFLTVPCAALANGLHGGRLVCQAHGQEPVALDRSPAFLERAWAATLFLDEVDDLSRQLQGRLLSFLAGQELERLGETNAGDPRIVSTTRCNLEDEVGAGRFRDDLFFRLNVVTIALPPLRERPDDIPALTDYFLARLVARHGRGPLHVSPDVRRLLAAHRWDGNVRELVSVLERAVILATRDTIGPDCLPERLFGRGRRTRASASPNELSLEELERQRIEQVLAESQTLGEAAMRLGINPTTLWRKRKRYCLARGESAGSSSDPAE
jgi:NtrC-family two-component system response regulator AlgB